MARSSNQNSKYETSVSIVTPVYNSEQFLNQTAESVFSQTMSDWEWLIVDDGSTDGSLRIAQQIAQGDERVRILHTNGREGAAVARNNAIRSARGRFIAFLDSDDMWEQKKLEKQIAFMALNNAALSHTSYSTVDEEGIPLGKVIRAKERIDYNQLLDYNMIGCLTAIYDREQVGTVLMPLVRLRQDYGLWLKILRQGHCAFGLDEVMAQYRIRTNSASSNKFRAASYTWQVLRHEEKLPLRLALRHFSRYVWHSVIKYMHR